MQARARIHAREQSGSAGPASAMLFAITLLFKATNQVGTGPVEAPNRRTRAELSHIMAQEGTENRRQQQTGFGLWLSAASPRPSPARTTVGGRTPETKRALSVGCLPAARRTSQDGRARLILSYRCHSVKGGSKESVVDSLASRCLSTEPLSTCQEPTATPKPSHRGRSRWI